MMKFNNLIILSVSLVFICFLIMFFYSLQHPSKEMMEQGSCVRNGGRWVVSGSHMEKVEYKNMY